jgi:hypothetical protein
MRKAHPLACEDGTDSVPKRRLLNTIRRRTTQKVTHDIVKIYYKNSFHIPNDTRWEERKRKKYYSKCPARGTTLRVGLMHFLRQTALICVNNINRPVNGEELCSL